MVYISLNELQELFVKNRYCGKSKKLFKTLSKGSTPSDELLIELLSLRLQFSDVAERGYILEGFPKNRQQAMLMYKNKIMPDVVISQSVEDFVLKDRGNRIKNLVQGSHGFEYDNHIMATRLKAESKELQSVVNLFNYNFGNVRRLSKDSTDSKVLELKLILEEYIRGRQAAAIGINLGKAFEASRLSIKKSTILSALGPSMNFSPISLQKYGAIEFMFLRSDKLLYYNRRFFLVADNLQLESFV